MTTGNLGMNKVCRWALLFFLCPFAVFLAVPEGRADLIILKDGFVLFGKVRHDRVYFSDPISKQVFWTAKLDGFYVIDDDARRIYFSAGQVADATKHDFDQAADLMKLEKVVRLNGGLQLPIAWQVDEVSGFDANWFRTIKLNVRGRSRPLAIDQKITQLTPHHARLDAKVYNWTACYLTSELGPEVVRTLILQHLGRTNQKVKHSESEKRFLLVRFLLQAGWHESAEEELLDLESTYPQEKKRVAGIMAILKKLQALKRVDAIELAQKAGQPRETSRLLTQLKRLKIDADHIGEKRMVAVQGIEGKIKTAKVDLKLAQKYLKELPDRVANSNHRKVFAEAAQVIAEDLRLDALGRLEGFIGLAKQEERYGKMGKRAGQNPAELFAMAVSGWLLGNDSAEATPAHAIKLWEARQLVLNFQNAAGTATRKNLLSRFAQRPPVGLDELTQLIRFLPPPEPEKKIDTKVREIKADAAGGGKGPTYLLKLPPEYHHHRSYPVLIVLHSGNGTSKNQLGRWSDLAAQNGYILAAPEWNKGGGTYGYTAQEHDIVIDVIRDLRRRVQVDSDRVFLFGFEEGGSMAFDVGLSHPDLFAAVVTMGGKPRWHAYHYWSNAQNLPFYVIDGTSNDWNPKYNRDIMKQWVKRGYPCLYVEYQGRGPEWLSGELPHIFEWLEPKKRATPAKTLAPARNTAACATDNRFYWLTTDDIKAGCLREPGWKTRPTPALFEGNIGSSNYIYVSTRGVNNITVWLAPASIDFEKPVTIRFNGTIVWPNKKIPPSLETLMEDFYERGDRHQLFLAKQVFKTR